jgi:hypothetical protein
MYSISPMAPQIVVLEHAFNFSLPDVPNKTVSCLSKLTFDGGGNISTKDHLNKFWCKCIKHDISDLGVLCRLFALTFRGRKGLKHAGKDSNIGLSPFQHVTFFIGFNL